jgi:CheY-like chemotaxis protein
MLDVEFAMRPNTHRHQVTKQQGATDMTGQLRIFVLDTSPTTRKILEVILHREGHLVACFDDPLEALRALSRYGPADLLFLSLDLPTMDAFDVLKYLRGEPRFQSVGTIALLDERDGVLVRLKARLAGAQGVVTKPLVRQQIVDLVSAYRWQRATSQESSQRVGSTTLGDCETAPRLEKE